MGFNKWFRSSSSQPTGTTQNERFAERLDDVWFKKSSGGSIRLGYLLRKLIDRVAKLEEAAKPKDAINIPSIEEGISTGRYSPEDVTRFRSTSVVADLVKDSRAVALYYGTKFLSAVGDEQIHHVSIDVDLEAAVIDAGKRVRFERKERNDYV